MKQEKSYIKIFANLSKFPQKKEKKKKKQSRRLGNYTICSGNSVTTRSMNASKPIGTIMILPGSTEENVGTQKKP